MRPGAWNVRRGEELGGPGGAGAVAHSRKSSRRGGERAGRGAGVARRARSGGWPNARRAAGQTRAGATGGPSWATRLRVGVGWGAPMGRGGALGCARLRLPGEGAQVAGLWVGRARQRGWGGKRLAGPTREGKGLKASSFVLFYFLPLVLLLKTCFSFEFNSTILPKFE
jgi:hypothetical protein